MTEIMIAVMAISFATVLLPPTTVVSVVITPIIAASIVIVVIAVVSSWELSLRGGFPQLPSLPPSAPELTPRAM
jgi:hypothetical protein